MIQRPNLSVVSVVCRSRPNNPATKCQACCWASSQDQNFINGLYYVKKLNPVQLFFSVFNLVPKILGFSILIFVSSRASNANVCYIITTFCEESWCNRILWCLSSS